MALFLIRLPLLIVSQSVTVVYPLYSSYKAVTAPSRSHSTLSNYNPYNNNNYNNDPNAQHETEMAQVETWIMYWSVIGCMRIVESLAEWSWSWFPFYFEAKLLFCLWLVLPQTRGATYLYVQYLGPFLATHEHDIDIALSDLKVKAKKMGAQWIERAWEASKEAIIGSATSQNSNAAPAVSGGGVAAAPPTINAPAQGAPGQLFGLLKHYAPGAIASAAKALDKASAGSRSANGIPVSEAIALQQQQGRSNPAPIRREGYAGVGARGAGTSATMSRAQALQRRRELEKALAELHSVSNFDSSSSSASGGGGGGGGASNSSDTDYNEGLRVPDFKNPNNTRGGGGRRVVSAQQQRVTKSSNESNSSSGNEDVSDDNRRNSKRDSDLAKRLSLGGSFDMLDQIDFTNPPPPPVPSKMTGEPSNGARRRNVNTATVNDTNGDADESWGNWFRRGGKSSPNPK